MHIAAVMFSFRPFRSIKEAKAPVAPFWSFQEVVVFNRHYGVCSGYETTGCGVLLGLAAQRLYH
jgi:hypothetical protein